ncbi:MAG: hypothetical protein PVJ21_22335 [Anaerolineales bacterium]|jgi:hypothetical protein
MRVTRESLIRLAKETVQERTYNNKDIIAAYLTGSLLTEDPFLGGVTDIDLVLVTANTPPMTREIVGLTPDFHLDISYRAKAEYNPPRELRVNPWLGYEIYDPMSLYDRQHFFEFTQAAVRAGFEFHEPALVLQRCRTLLDHGRKIWFDIMDIGEDSKTKDVAKYLKSLYHAVNVIAELNGPPLPERRLLLMFPSLAEQAERPGLSVGLLGLLGASNLDASTLESWLPEWESAFKRAFETGKADPRIHTARLNYYKKCFEAMLGSDNPTVMLWPLFNSWTRAIVVLPEDEIVGWQTARTQLGLSGAGFVERVEGLDHYLDELDILLDEIAAANGLETSTSF